MAQTSITVTRPLTPNTFMPRGKIVLPIYFVKSICTEFLASKNFIYYWKRKFVAISVPNAAYCEHKHIWRNKFAHGIINRMSDKKKNASFKLFRI